MKTRNHLLNKIFTILLVVACFTGFVLATNPNSVALPLLIVPFILLGIILYQLVFAVLFVIMSHKNNYLRKIISLSVASLGVGLLLLQSLDQLTLKDSLLAFIFAILFWVYIWRADFLHK